MRKKKAFKIAGIILAAVLVTVAAGCICGSVWTGKQVALGLLLQNEGKDTKQNSIRQLETWGYDIEAFEKEHSFQPLELTADDGNVIPAQFFETPGSKKTAILVHGLGGDHVSLYPLAEMYLKHDWNVLTFDQRASGDSSNPYVSFGYFEKRDVQALAAYAKQILSSDTVVVHGQSMGAATAALYAAEPDADEFVDALILDSCFDSMENMFLGVWRSMDTDGIPEDYVVACGDRYLKYKYGFGFANADVSEALKDVAVKTLMLQMCRDDIVPTETAKKMYQNLMAPEKKICYFNSEHVEGIIDDPLSYEEAVFSFLQK